MHPGTYIAFILLLLLCACKNPGERATDARTEAAREIADEQRDVREEEIEGQEEMAESADVEELEEEKIEATKEIADEEADVDDEKIEATEEITEAEQDMPPPE